MEVYRYRTIQGESQGDYKEKGSKFLSFAYPVSSEAGIKGKIDELKRAYFDARHHCFAWTLGPEMEKFRAFDDGEPNHSAGDPILGQIRSRKLTDVLVVVVRYFGGVKLGIGGLISAYRQAAENVLDAATIIEQEVFEPLSLRFDYLATSEVMRLLKSYRVRIVHQQFEADTTLDLEVAKRNHKEFNVRLDEIIARGANIVVLP